MKKIAIQGIKGCFHHESIIFFFWINGYEIIECKNFYQLIQVITNREAHLGIIAIENAIIGNLLSNYIFLANHNFKIISSIVKYIDQNIIGFIENQLNEIISHLIALQQCDIFISKYTKLKTIEYSDTGISSLYVYKKMLKKKSSIASKLSAKEYKLNIIKNDIQNISNNFTIFILIEPSQKKINENFDKSSICFCINKNCYKNLLNILSFIEKKKINFIKIVIFINSYGEYLFYIDIIIDDNIEYENFKSKIKNKSYTFFIIGEYINFIFL